MTAPAQPRSTGTTGLLDGPVLFPRHGTERVHAEPADDLAAHVARYGPRPTTTADAVDMLLDAMTAAALTGRGGGHFPAAAKWRAARAAGARLLVVNGAEGEPASAKDAALLQQRAHLVLDGVAAAAEALGATDAVVWLHDGAHATRRAVERALLERAWADLSDPAVRIRTGPDHYLSGQVSAVLRALGGGPALPRAVEPAAPWGDGPPALLHNVETWARVGLLARAGAPPRPTSLVTLVTPAHRVVREVDVTTTIGDLVAEEAPLLDPAAVLVGGYGGSWWRWTQARDLPLDQAAWAARGDTLGAGVLAPLDRGSCGLVETSRVLSYLAASSARQCGACLFGLDAVAELAARLARGGLGRADRRRLARYGEQVRGRGACAHPDGASRLLASALAVFDADARSHRDARGCTHRPAGPPLLPIPGDAR